MSKHALSPWAVHFVDDTTVIDRCGRFVASVCGGDDDLGSQDYNNPDEWPVLEANARLIAAAPDMLEALKAAREKILTLAQARGSEVEFAEDYVADIDAAIAKAEGR